MIPVLKEITAWGKMGTYTGISGKCDKNKKL